MAIGFSDARWDRVSRNFELWWQGKLGRPLVCIEVQDARDPGRPAPKLPSSWFTSYYDLSVPAEAIVDRWDYDLSRRKFLGDSFPAVFPNFGPGVAAAFLGAELHNGGAESQTTWFHPSEEREITDLHFADRYDPDNVWLRRIRELTRTAAKTWNGQAQVAMTDLGGALDVLSSFRPSEKLLYDLYDHPEDVKRCVGEIHKLWWRYYDELHAAMREGNRGYTAWTQILSQSPYYMLQCDFCYMIGPDMFDEFVKPELTASCVKLPHSFYHLDGPGELPHLPSLLSIPELKGVQWIPGAGAPAYHLWPEVYRQIHKAGKLIQIFLDWPDGVSNLEIIADQIGSADRIVVFGSVSADQEAAALALCRKFGAE